MMPQPIRAGISGTKMFAILRRNSLKGVEFFAFCRALRAAPLSASSSAVWTGAGVSDDARPSSTSCSNSGVTRATVPGPRTIW